MSEDLHPFWPFVPVEIPIPKIFQSLKEGPFQRCVQCDADLLAGRLRYCVERVFRGDEPIVEYAICQPCTEKLREELSRDSQERIEQFVREHGGHGARIERLRKGLETRSVEPWIDHCLFTGAEAEQCRERTLSTWCEGDQLLLGAWPYMVSGEATEQINELLSEQTRGWMNDFIEEHFGMPPEFCDSPDVVPILI